MSKLLVDHYTVGNADLKIFNKKMLRVLVKCRKYCKKVNLNIENQLKFNSNKQKLDFKELKYTTKVPQEPIKQQFPDTPISEITIDTKTIQLLERLSLVDLDGKEALATLKNSIQFANKIASINTKDVAPLYTVVEEQNLYLRDDNITEGNCREQIISNAKTTDEDYFVSPPGNIPLEQEAKNFEEKN